MIAIVDYGVGNLGSIKNMLDRIGAESLITCDAATIAAAEKIILPGVGAFDRGMQNLRTYGLIDVLEEKVRKQRTNFLAICLGMQLLTWRSEEGAERGLGWVEGDTIRFPSDLEAQEGVGRLPVPHMGWNALNVQHRACRLFEGLGSSPRFYFVHSYYVRPADTADVAARTVYGMEFTSAIQRDNIFGVQFHPEKSHKFGMTLLRNFANL